ncbi:MAG: VanZ family protein [Clostridia bacterium]|nr:VanZ family protein [Clostridia bacterium]
MKMNRKTILPAGLILLVTGFIFSNSFKGIEASRADSDVVLGWFRPLLERLFGPDAELMDFIVRKAAHMTEFCVLALLICWLSGVLKRAFHGYGLFYTLSVAVVDEFIQSFSDRTSLVADILIDFSGALIGFGAVLLIKTIIKRKKHGD